MKSKQRNEWKKRWTISWEAAYRRELEYQRKINKQAQHQDKEFLAKFQQQESQQQVPDPNRVSVNGECSSAHESAGVDNQLPPIWRYDDHVSQQGFRSQSTNPNKFSLNGKSPCGSTFVQKSTRTESLLLFQKLNTQMPKQGLDKIPHPKAQRSQHSLQNLMDEKFSIQCSKDQRNSNRSCDPPREWPREYKCSICKVICSNFLNFKQHCEGKRHKANVQTKHDIDKASGGDGILWCEECEVPCMNENNLKQHLVGKKHLTRIGMLATEHKRHPAEESFEPFGICKRLRRSGWPRCM